MEVEHAASLLEEWKDGRRTIDGLVGSGWLRLGGKKDGRLEEWKESIQLTAKVVW